MTVKLAEGVINTFDFTAAKVNKDDLTPGAGVAVTANVKDAKLEDNVFKATKITLE